MIAENRWMTALLIVTAMLLAGSAYGQITNNETATTTNSAEVHTISEDDPQKGSDEEKKSSGGFFLTGELHKVLREERIETLREIDAERKATLAYLTQERAAVVDEAKKELKRITDLLLAERRMTMVEVEEIGMRITESAILKSEKLIDHFFVRAFQFVSIIMLFIGIAGFITYRIVVKNR